MKLLKILVIDDERLIRWSFEKQFNIKGHKIFSAETGEEGVKLFEKHYPDIVFVDNKLPGIQGLEVISRIKAIDESAAIVFMTAYGSIDTAVQAMKRGAIEYINKPFSFDEIKIIIQNIKNNINIASEIQLLKHDQKNRITFENIIGDCPVFNKIIQISKKIALSKTTMVLLLGESGTGKDLFARAIHNDSSRKGNPFVTINCSMFPETLIESELFGHEKGAFTDANQLKKGLFEIAEGGTVFLDEIGELNHYSQVKLLNVLENRTIKRVGGTSDIPVDVRIVAATNKDLEKSVEENEFRKDLFYRLKVFQVELPPLRDRKNDIPELLSYFLKQFTFQFQKNIKGISPEAKKLLCNYYWPGNIRELRNVMERAVILENGNIIQIDNLPQEIYNEPVNANADNTAFSLNLPDDGISMEDIEKQFIIQALKKTFNNQSKASRLLGISRDKLRYKKKKYNL